MTFPIVELHLKNLETTPHSCSIFFCRRTASNTQNLVARIPYQLLSNQIVEHISIKVSAK